MKTIKEAAKEYSHENYSPELYRSDLNDAFLAGVRFANGWVSVEDELPGENEDVLVKVKDYATSHGDHFVTTMFLLDGCWQDELSGGTTDGRVTHWRPIEFE